MDKAINRTEASVLTLTITDFDASTDDTAQIPGPVEYRIQDFWGDEPAAPEYCEPVEVQSLSMQQVLPAQKPRPSLVQRLRIWFVDPLFVAPINPTEHLPAKTSARHAG